MVVDFLEKNPWWARKLSGIHWAVVRSTRVRVIAIADGNHFISDANKPINKAIFSKIEPRRCLYDAETGELVAAAAPAPNQAMFDHICRLQRSPGGLSGNVSPYIWSGAPVPSPVAFEDEFEAEMWEWTGGVDSNCPHLWYVGNVQDMYRPPVLPSDSDGSISLCGHETLTSPSTGASSSHSSGVCSSGSSRSVVISSDSDSALLPGASSGDSEVCQSY